MHDHVCIFISLYQKPLLHRVSATMNSVKKRKAEIEACTPVTRHIGRKSSFANDGRHDFIPRQNLSPSHSIESRWKGIKHPFSNNDYQQSYKERKLLRQRLGDSSPSPSGSSLYPTPPSLVPRTGSARYLDDLKPFDGRKRLDHVRDSDVKSDHRSNRASQSSDSKAVSEDSYAGLYS